MRANAHYLRMVIKDIIAPTMELRRNSVDEIYLPNDLTDFKEPPFEEEITDFVLSNQLYDQDLVIHLSDPGLLGFNGNLAQISDGWLVEFRNNTRDWANSNSWLGGDEPIWVTILYGEPENTEIWTPEREIIPQWLDLSPSYLLLAKELIAKGKHLSGLNWRDFENLIGYLLEKDGWEVNVTQATKDGGIDVIALKNDLNLGQVKSVWQAKKYGTKNLVRLNEVRELYAAREESKSSKAFIVTTNKLTKNAIEWIMKDEYRFGYKEGDDISNWINRITGEKYSP